jgi:(E)-4-hydroxy-3-methyl-but-2-enyl pyrophosphate reductase
MARRSEEDEGLEILVAADLGMCSGLRTIFAKAQRETARRKVAVFGDFVHNPAVYDRLADTGASRIDNLSQVRPGMSVLIGPHGNQPGVLEGIREAGGELIDTSCHRVKKVIDAAFRLHDQGYALVFVGDPTHEEAHIIRSRVPDLTVIGPRDSITKKSPPGPIGVIAQSTETTERFLAVVEALREQTRDVTAVNTVCSETHRRQLAATNLAQEVDLVIVVGSRSSYNTRALATTCMRHARVLHINGPGELTANVLQGAHRVGITAGASTPDWIVDAVVAHLRDIAERRIGASRVRARVRLSRLTLSRARSRLGSCMYASQMRMNGVLRVCMLRGYPRGEARRARLLSH